jgi:hypothetical protein
MDEVISHRLNDRLMHLRAAGVVEKNDGTFLVMNLCQCRELGTDRFDVKRVRHFFTPGLSIFCSIPQLALEHFTPNPDQAQGGITGRPGSGQVRLDLRQEGVETCSLLGERINQLLPVIDVILPRSSSR